MPRDLLTLSPEGYERLRALLLVRADRRCEACRSPRITGELEHAVPRSKGRMDTFFNCWIPCPPCRDMKVAPFARGRLLVDPMGDGRFRFRLVLAPDRRAFLRGDYELRYDRIGGRAATEEELAILEALR